jgi:hypothetical protein
LASVLAVIFYAFLGVGAPPSEFAPRESAWWTLEPLMFPALFGGVFLAIVAVVSSCLPSGMRGAAYFCLAATISTGTGVVVAEGIAEHFSIRVVGVSVVLLAIPALAAIDVLRRVGHRRETHAQRSAAAGRITTG